MIVKGPPIIIPAVPVKNMMSALGPSFMTSLRSTLMVSSTKAAGSKYREAIKYNLDCDGSMSPVAFRIEGRKLAKRKDLDQSELAYINTGDVHCTIHFFAKWHSLKIRCHMPSRRETIFKSNMEDKRQVNYSMKKRVKLRCEKSLVYVK